MISVGIITYNEEFRLGRTLEAVKEFADEIVIVDSFSTDNTIEIAREYGVRIFQREWIGYGDQKNYVIEKCQGDWILLIDADEVITKELKEEIKNITYKNEKTVYEIPFNSVCFGKRIRFGGWSGSSRIRLFKKNSGKYSLDKVHEKFITTERIGKLKKRIDHYTYEDYEDYLNKFNRYTGEGAQVAFEKGKKAGLFNILLNPIFKFIRMYIFRLGVLDGVEGLVLAVSSAMYTSVKYVKLRNLTMDYNEFKNR